MTMTSLPAALAFLLLASPVSSAAFSSSTPPRRGPSPAGERRQQHSDERHRQRPHPLSPRQREEASTASADDDEAESAAAVEARERAKRRLLFGDHGGGSGTSLSHRRRPQNQQRRRRLGSPPLATRRRTSARRDAVPSAPRRPLAPPFPNGPCGGTVVTLRPEDTFGKLSDMKNDGGIISFGNFAAGVASNEWLLPPRPIKVWLPPCYNDGDGSGRKYSVLYCHDGQNALDDSESWTGHSWRLPGALTRLSERNLLHNNHGDGREDDDDDGRPPILVLLPSASGDILPGLRRRHLEYGDPATPTARAHADFVATVVKPLIDRTYRTAPGPEGTHAIGSSLGGQAALHLVLRHPDAFGGAACLSPCFQAGTLASVVSDCVSSVADATNDKKKRNGLHTKRIYIDNGGDDTDGDTSKTVPWFEIADHVTDDHWWNPGYWWLDTQLQPGIDAVRAVLDMAGVDHVYEKFPGARHNERAWSRRIDRPLLHLYGRRSSSSSSS